MYWSLIDTFFGIHQYSWTTVRSLNAPQDGYLIPVTPKDLDGFNKELPTLELHGVLKKSFLDIFECMENESILEISEWMAANNGLHINGRTLTPPSYTEHTTTGTTSVSIPSETEHLWILGLFVGLLVSISIFLFICFYKKGYICRRLNRPCCNHAQHVWTQ